jgi:YD repeat-containing protein
MTGFNINHRVSTKRGEAQESVTGSFSGSTLPAFPSTTEASPIATRTVASAWLAVGCSSVRTSARTATPAAARFPGFPMFGWYRWITVLIVSAWPTARGGRRRRCFRVSEPGNLSVHHARRVGAHRAYVDDVVVADLAGEAPIVSYGYDDAGRLTSESLASGARQYSWVDGQLRGITQTLPGVSDVIGLGYDQAGRVSTEVVNGVTTSYGYDVAGQLTGVTREGYAASYGYDAVGRRVSRVVNGVTEGFAYDDADRLVASGGVGVPATSYGYDAAGRLSSVVAVGAPNSFYRYDSAGRLRSVAATPTGVGVKRPGSGGGFNP